MKKNPCKNHPDFELGSMGCGCLVAEAFDQGLKKVNFPKKLKPDVEAVLNSGILMATGYVNPKRIQRRRPGLGAFWLFTWKVDRKHRVRVVISEEADAIVTICEDGMLMFRRANVALALAKTRESMDALSVSGKKP